MFQVDRQAQSIDSAMSALVSENTPERKYRLVLFPRADEEAFGSRIPLEVNLAVTGHTHVFAVVRVAQGIVHFGSVAAAEHIYSTQPTFTPVCRAYWKLEEIVARYQIPCIGVKAVDIGAAPGGNDLLHFFFLLLFFSFRSFLSSLPGWTQFLARAGASRVVAIDPAQMTLPEHPSITHLRMRLQDALTNPILQSLVPFDLLVADMNVHPAESADLMVTAATALLKPGGYLVMTAKLVKGFSTSLDRQQQLDATREVLAKLFENVEEVWALANGNERTMIGRRKMI